MSHSHRLHAVHASVTSPDAVAAVAELRAQLALPDRAPRGVILFCSPKYDLDVLGRELGAAFACPVIGCTTAGQIGPRGFQPGGIAAVAVYSDELSIRTYLIDSLVQVQGLAAAVGARARAECASADRAFGLLLVDGLSVAEERLTATLYQALDGIPIVGGSAGDDLAFQQTHVYHAGRFHRNAAVLSMFETALPFAPFKFQHFEPTDTRLVITGAIPERRIVTEINGAPATEAYAEAIGQSVDQLTPELFARHPLMLRSGSDYYVRSIARVSDDRSITFLCAIDEGLVLTIGSGVDAVETVTQAFADVTAKVGAPQLVLGCDCILRRLELEHTALAPVVGDLFVRHRVIGFSTYGEQFNGMHVNQTFTGVALGG